MRVCCKVMSTQSAKRTLGHLALAVLLTLPGLGIAALYVRRLEGLRCDPQIPACAEHLVGPPTETWIAIVAVALVIASARFAIAAGVGRLSSGLAMGVFLALAAVAGALVLLTL